MDNLKNTASFNIIPFYTEKDLQNYGYFSQWYKCKFNEDNITFNSAEQYMMYSKAVIFRDYETAKLILEETSNYKIKQLGREVKNFNTHVWDNYKISIVTRGNYLKFSQNEDLKNILLGTGDATLVEASPYDTIWGVGLSIEDPNVKIPGNWKGLNLLGECLMMVRSVLLEERNHQWYFKFHTNKDN